MAKKSRFCQPELWCYKNTVIFLMHADNVRKQAQWTKSRQLSCSNVSRCVFI